jgi:hypothetical protein
MKNNLDIQNELAPSKSRLNRRRIGVIAAGIGLGSLVALLLSKVLGADQKLGRPDHIVDDRGTGQEKAARILRHLRDRAFESSDEKLALALGRPAEEIASWNAGLQLIDDDVIMKARGIAMNRGIRVE